MALTQISTEGVKDNAVTAGKIPANAVGASELAANAVDTAAIATDAVTGAKIADDAINSEHYTDGSIDTAHIADNAVTNAKILNNVISNAKMMNDAITQNEIADNAVVTAGIANDAVTTAKIADDAITGAKMGNSSVGTVQIVDGAITGAKMGSGSIGTTQIVDGSITGAKMGNSSVGTAQIVDANVTTAKIADNAVTTSKLPANSVTTTQIADSHVTTAKINNSAVTEAKIASGAVTQTKISDQSIINAKVDNSAAIAGTKISPDFGSQNIETDGEVRTGTYIKTRVAGGGHFYLRNNSTGANYSSHLQTCSGGESSNVQTFVHYYHGGYAELLHQGNSSVRTLSNGTQFRNGGNVNGQINPNGLCFGSDTAAANALDDYEQGSWSPSTYGNWYNIGTFRNTIYTKVGRLVTVHFDLFQTNNNMGWDANVSVRGFPYEAESSLLSSGSCNTFSYTSGDAKWIPNYVDAYTNAQLVLHSHAQSQNIRHLLFNFTYMAV